MKKHIDSKKLSLTSETVRQLRSLDGTSLHGVAGGESITGTCTDCNTYTKHGKVKDI